MRNIKVYDSFLNNINCSFKIRLFKISLARTFIFNFDDDDIYYRKTSISRKISLVGKERTFLVKRKINLELDLLKYNIKRIDNILLEYISDKNFVKALESDKFDIVEKKKKRIVTSDSVIRKFYRDEIVTMCFEEKDKNFANMFWLNQKNYQSKYQNMNI